MREEAVRLLLHHRFELDQRFLRLAVLEQHVAEQLARRRDRARRDRRLVGQVFHVGGLAHLRRSRASLRPCANITHASAPRRWMSTWLGPVLVLHLDLAIADRGELGDVGRGVDRLARREPRRSRARSA